MKGTPHVMTVSIGTGNGNHVCIVVQLYIAIAI